MEFKTPNQPLNYAAYVVVFPWKNLLPGAD